MDTLPTYQRWTILSLFGDNWLLLGLWLALSTALIVFGIVVVMKKGEGFIPPDSRWLSNVTVLVLVMLTFLSPLFGYAGVAMTAVSLIGAALCIWRKETVFYIGFMAIFMPVFVSAAQNMVNYESELHYESKTAKWLTYCSPSQIQSDYSEFGKVNNVASDCSSVTFDSTSGRRTWRIELVGDATKDGQDYRLVELGMK